MNIAEIIAWLMSPTVGQQIKNSLDPTTSIKIIKGCFRAFLSTGVYFGVLAVLNYLAGVQLADPMLTSILVWMAQAGTNAWVQYNKGAKGTKLSL